MFLYTGESVRFNKNAHCFAVEPSGWRFTFDASIFVTLFRRFAPSDSPRVHQKTTATAVVFVYGGVRAFKQKRTLLRSRTLPADATLSMQASSLRYCVTTFLSTPPGYTKKQPQPRLFLYTGGRTLRLTASEERSKRLHLRKSNAADIANNRTQSVKCKALARMRGC